MTITGKLPLPQPIWNPLWKNPFTNKPQLPDAQFSADIDYWKLNSSKLPTVEIVDNECNLGVNVSAVGGVFKSIGVSVTYRNPSAKCNPPPPKPPLPKPTPPKTEYWDLDSPPLPDNDVNLSPCGGIILYVGCFVKFNYILQEYTQGSLVDFRYAYSGTNPNQKINLPMILQAGGGTGFTSNFAIDNITFTVYWNVATPYYQIDKAFAVYAIGAYVEETSIDWSKPTGTLSINRILNKLVGLIGKTSNGSELKAEILSIKVTHPDNDGCPFKRLPPPPEPPKPPPPPPKKRCCNDMCCCNDNGKNENNNDLLRALLAKVKKLSEIVGVDDYPASLPNSFITKNGNHPGNTNIPNLTQILGWYFQRFDEVVGQFEVDIDVKLPNGDTESIHLPNIAESIGEIITMLFHQTYNSELLVNICNRALIEAGQNKQQGFKIHQALHSVIDYLGFAYNEQSENMPLSFKPGETSFQKMLKETEVPVSVVEYDGKQQGLHPVLLDLLQAAAIIRAVHWRQLNPNGNLTGQLISTIKLAKDVKDALHKHDDCLDLDTKKLETLEDGADTANS